MMDGLALMRRRGPEDPVEAALVFFSLIAAAGFAMGWLGQAVAGAL